MKTIESKYFYLIAFFSVMVAGCDDPVHPLSVQPHYINISTDKSAYQPGESVAFEIDNNSGEPINVNVKLLGETIESTTITGNAWTWIPPHVDFRAYMIEFSKDSNSQNQIIGTIAVEVSSDWTKFPRYGFISRFGQMGNAKMDSVIENLARFHINGIQFYDWVEKPYKPLSGTVAIPAENWFDITNRPTSKSTILSYILKAHQKGMKAIFNNHCDAALENAGNDGVSQKWYLYSDVHHANKVFFDSAGFYKGPIYLLDPGNSDWAKFAQAQVADLYSVYNFDGFQVDQFGNHNLYYDYLGYKHGDFFNYFLQTMNSAFATKNLLFREIKWYEQWSGSVDFYYRKITDHSTSYADLANDSWEYMDHPKFKTTVLEAFVNHALSGNSGFFNTPSVLFADAVIFAFSGSHLEIGEHMCNQDFLPNNLLSMKQDLKTSLVAYYDFLVAYENLLQAGIDFNSPGLVSKDGKVDLQEWPPQIGKVALVGKQVDHREVVHLINFTNASTLDWRDNQGIQNKPIAIENFKIEMTLLDPVKKIWFASPDFERGASSQLDFKQEGLHFTFTVPYLEYWSMIVVEY